MAWYMVILWILVITGGIAFAGYALRNQFPGIKTDISGTLIAIGGFIQAFDFTQIISGFDPSTQGLILFGVGIMQLVLRRITTRAASWTWKEPKSIAADDPNQPPGM